MKHKRIIHILILLLLLISACTSATQGRDAKEFLPTLNGYNSYPGTKVSEDLKTIGLGAAVLTQNPVLAAKVYLMDKYVSCYEKMGALAFKVYQSQNDRFLAGLVVSINVERSTSLDAVQNCIVGAQSQNVSSQPEYRPCYEAWRYEENDTTYFFLYAATDVSVCEAFKAQMPGI